MRKALVLASFALVAACKDQPAPAPPPPLGAAMPEMPSSGSARAPVTSIAPPPSATKSGFAPERIWQEGGAMGTHLAFAAYTTEKVDAAKTHAAIDAAIAEIKRIEALMTTWRPDSEISKINAAAGTAPVAVSEETFQVVKESVHASEISQGTFDITFETLHGLWKFDQDLDPHPPSDKDLKERLAFVGYKNIVLDETKHTVMLAKEKTKISLGGIAKGYAVDKAVKVLETAGLTSFFVQAGGDLYARGTKPDGQPWQAGVRDPRGASGSFFAVLPISDHAFSTAGDYERSYIANGKRYHHIIDPRTGYPATACRSVTIWAPTALLADEIDDAVFILGPKMGLELVESLDGVGAVVVDAQNHTFISKRLEGKIKVVAPPSEGL